MPELESTHNLLALSDLHLGHALKRSPPANAEDGALVAWLDHHAVHRLAGRPWRLLLVGDVLDFISVVATPPVGAAAFAFTEEERRFGLDSTEEKSAWKLGRIADHHRQAFAALARFAARGHEVIFVRGNHDLELAWPGVQQGLRSLLGAGLSSQEAERRIQFRDRAYLEPGRAYLEHGHAYDCFCLPEEAILGEPALPLPVSSLVLKYFANRHAAQDEIEQASDWGSLDYLRWFARRHAPWRVAFDYAAMIARILAIQWRARRPRRRDSLEGLREHLLLTGRGQRLGPSDLTPLSVEPALLSVVRVCQLFYLERMALVLLALASVVGLLRTSLGIPALAWSMVVGAAVGLMLPILARARRTESHALLERAAHQLADLFEVPLVAMGHTHRPVDVPVGRGLGRYVNLGSWTHPGPQGFPYLVVGPAGSGLRHWPAGALQPAPLPELEPAFASRSA